MSNVGRIFHWLPCVRSNSVKMNESSTTSVPGTPKARPPASHKGEKFNSKNHGWRSWGKEPAHILLPESEEQRRDINEDMVKAISEYMAQRPFQYRSKDEPVEQQKQQDTEQVKEKSVKPLPFLATETVDNEPDKEEQTSSYFEPELIAEIESTKTPSSAQNISEKGSPVAIDKKPVQNNSTPKAALMKPMLQPCIITSSISIVSEPSGDSTEYTILSGKSPPPSKVLEHAKTPTASGSKMPPTTSDTEAQSSALPHRPRIKPLFTKSTPGIAEKSPNANPVKVQPSENSPYLVVTKDVRPTVSVIIQPPLGGTSSVIMNNERVLDSNSKSRTYVSKEQCPRPLVSVVVNPPLQKSLGLSSNEEKDGKLEKSELANKKLLKEPLAVTRSTTLLGKQPAIEITPSQLNMKPTSSKSRPEGTNTPSKSRTAMRADSDDGPTANGGQIHKEKSKTSQTSLGGNRP